MRDFSTDGRLQFRKGLIGPLTAGLLLEKFGGTDAGAAPYKPTMVGDGYLWHFLRSLTCCSMSVCRWWQYRSGNSIGFERQGELYEKDFCKSVSGYAQGVLSERLHNQLLDVQPNTWLLSHVPCRKIDAASGDEKALSGYQSPYPVATVRALRWGTSEGEDLQTHRFHYDQDRLL